MRRTILLACLLLAGCASIARLDSDSFAVGAHGVEAFEDDDQTCRTQARDYVGYDLHVIGDTSYAANRAWNRIYGRCMRGLGHRDRAYARNWLPN